MRPVFPLIVFLIFLVIATGLKTGLDLEEETQIRQNLAADTEVLSRQLKQDFLDHVIALRRMASRMHAQPELTEAAWRQDARNYLNDFQTFQAIEWIDRNSTVRWVEPAADDERARGFNAAYAPTRRQALETSRREGSVHISGVVRLAQGARGLVVYVPVGVADDNNGFVAGTFRMEKLSNAVILPRIRNRFSLELIEDGKVAFTLPSASPSRSDFSYTTATGLPSVDWSLRVKPTRQWVERYRSPWPWVTFLSMLTLGVLMALTILLAQLILRRNRTLLRTRQELEEEIDQRVAVQQDLARLASTDPLTGLANRRFFMEDLAHTLSQAGRQERQVALIMIDLDRFQMLNDSLGHHFGDKLLAQVSRRLEELRDDGVMVGYSGGDEFMACQQHLDNIDDVIHLLGLLKACFSQPFDIDAEEHAITATMGVAVYPQSGLDADILLRNADIALYRAKEQGRNSYQFYTEGMQEREVRRLQLNKDLSEALARNQFELYYQPQLDLTTFGTGSMEALLRWNHPERGLVPPGEFIPLAEESGRITEIGRWVVRAACRQIHQWRDTPMAGLRIAVNLSGRELAQADLADYLVQCFREYSVEPRQLEIELTEESFIANIEHNHQQLRRISELGVYLAIDDFGVGYSSLGYLRDFTVDLLKIDRSFITNVTERHDDAVITRAVINLAHNLGIKVVAEGVETEAQLQFLRHHRCDLAQGYLLSRPVPAAEVPALFAGSLLPASLREHQQRSGRTW